MKKYAQSDDNDDDDDDNDDNDDDVPLNLCR